MAETVPTWQNFQVALDQTNLNQMSVAIRDLDSRLSAVEGTVNTVAAAGSSQTLPDVTTATIHDLTLNSATCALTFPTASTGKSFTLFLRQDATGGRAVTWPAGLKWPAGAAPTLTTTAGAVDVFSFLSVASVWYGFSPGMDLR